MSRALRVLVRIVGSAVLSLGSGVLGFLGAWAVVVRIANGNEDAGLIGVILLCPPGFLLRATIGAAVGLLAGIFVIYCLWRLDVNMAGEWWEIAVAGVSAPIAAGAVIGSGWKATAADTASP